MSNIINKIKKNKFSFLSVFMILIVSISFVSYSFYNKDVSIDLINITSLSEEFMNNYFNGMKEINEIDNKSNILIVSSKKDVGDGYGALKVVPAPNNQYILQYSSEEEKNNAFSKFKDNKNIISVGENNIYTISEIDGDMWSLEKNYYSHALAEIENKNLNDVVVAVIDTGCEVSVFNETYPNRLFGTYNVLDKTNDVTDKWSHGTFISGIIAGITPSNVKLLPIKILHKNNDGTGTAADLIAALNYAIYNNVDIINLSLGGGYDANVEVVIKAAIDANITVVSAVGNDNHDIYQYPAAYDNVIAVSAVDSNFERTNFSNYGDYVDFAAPGYKIEGLYYSNAAGTYTSSKIKDGTSFSAPHVAGAVGILKSFNKNLTYDNVIDLLSKYAIDIGDDGYDKYYGNGVVSFAGAKFCDEEVECDSYNVFEKSDINTYSTIKISASNKYVPLYNYGNITNIMNAEINLYYKEDEYYTKTLGQLINDIKVINYDPFSYTEQNVIIKYKDFETTLEVDNRNLSSGWTYEILEDDTIKLTGINYNKETIDVTYDYSSYPRVIYIPDKISGKTVKVLGENIFIDMNKLKRVIIPFGVEIIEKGVFGRTEELGSSEYLELGNIAVVFPKSIQYIDDDAFIFREKNEVLMQIYKETVPHHYVNVNGFNHIYPDIVKVGLNKREYFAFEKITENFTINITYDGTEGIFNEIVDDYQIVYNNDDSFRFGDNKFSIILDTKLGYRIEGSVPVIVNKAIPTYNLPTNLTGMVGQKITEIELPSGFSWIDNTIIFNNGGNNKYKIIYTPEDTDNYEIVKDIDVEVFVNKIEVNPSIIVLDKIYDGTNNINIDDIDISNLDSGDYTIESAISISSNVGESKAIIKLKLSDEYFKTHSFTGDLQEKEYSVDIRIIKSDLDSKQIFSDFSVIYDGNLHGIKLKDNYNNINILYMDKNGNYTLSEMPKYKDVGEYLIAYKINSNNYNELYGVNKLKIYGIKEIASDIKVESDILLVTSKDNSFESISNKVKVFAETHTFKHLDNKDKLLSTDRVGTGNKMNIKINNLVDFEYYISILGDVTGDGYVDIADVVKIADHTITKKLLKEKYDLLASDVTNDNIIDIADVIKIADYTIDNSINLWR